MEVYYNKPYVQGPLLLILFWALFATDLFAAANAPDSTNDPVGVLMIITLVIFAVEIVVCCVCQKNYK